MSIQTLQYIDNGNDFTAKEDIWEEVAQKSKTFEKSIEQSIRRNTGSYYTDLEFAKYLIDEIFDSVDDDYKSSLPRKTFLEPCVGSGNFVFAYLKKVYELGFRESEAQSIINNIYVCDINLQAILLYKELFIKFVDVYFGLTLEDGYFDKRVAYGLLIDVNQDNPQYIHIDKVFREIYRDGGFDIVVTNPPYKNLKAEKGQYKTTQDYENSKEIYSKISFLANINFRFSNDGVLNLYKLFVEDILVNYSKDNGIVAVLIPGSILSDKTCEKLRTYILTNHSIKSINVIKENNPYIDARQTLCTMLIHKAKQTGQIYVNKDFRLDNQKGTIVDIEDIMNPDTGNSIFALGDQEYLMLKQLKKFPTIKQLPFIINMRGELDLTANSNSIINEPSKNKLLRGRNIGYYFLNELDGKEYVKTEFIVKSRKKEYIIQPRIICQQVVNIHKERRVTFSYIESGHVLGNSCNFICVTQNDFGIDLYYLLGLLNSKIINWYFKLTSTNNHVNNYEIDCFPIPTESQYIEKIKKMVKQYLSTEDKTILEEIDATVSRSYGIKLDCGNLEDDNCDNELALKYYRDIKNIIPDFNYEIATLILNEDISLESFFTGINIDPFDKKICNLITEKYVKLKKGQILNHSTSKLSDLDLEMVRAIPQGGNWKDIPNETIKKSQRLIRISETGGRTTLYGRIDYNKPSYTITTYFNRPGNGTYIHPIHDRVISAREAARFQSFKDDYYFTGNKGNLLNQIGNAVPPLLAYQIAKQIIEKTKCTKSLDLFCGAGGMTAGFKEAGMHSVLGVDIDKSACVTFKVNNPEIKVLCEDITKPEVKKNIIEIAKNNKVEVICGGPPCQGFSHAGKRFVDDPRNELFKHFIEVVGAINPKVVIMENVEGMLTFQSGDVYKQIIELFSDLGYNAKGRVLLASDYGVPQRRKRVIIVCIRNDMSISPDIVFPYKIILENSLQINARAAIGDLESIKCDETALYIPQGNLSDYVKELRYMLPYGNHVALNTNYNNSNNIYFKQVALF